MTMGWRTIPSPREVPARVATMQQSVVVWRVQLGHDPELNGQ